MKDVDPELGFDRKAAIEDHKSATSQAHDRTGIRHPPPPRWPPAVPDPSPHNLTGLYVHIPFRETIRLFCPFDRSVGTDDRITQYLSAIIREAEFVGRTARAQSLTYGALYIAGTLSVLSIKQLEQIFTAVLRNCKIAPDAEVIYEFEPKSITPEKLRGAHDRGVTASASAFRPSISGCATSVYLTATREEVENAIRLSTAAFERTTSAPHQDEESALNEVATGRSGITRVSIYPVAYLMTVPSLIERIGRGEVPRPMPALARHGLFSHGARAHLRTSNVGENYLRTRLTCV